MVFRKLFVVLIVSAVSFLTIPVGAQTLYTFDAGTLFDGAFGPVARMQAKVRLELATCGRPATMGADGKFGPGTRNALIALATCPRFVAPLANDRDARAGAMTVTYWRALLADDPPGLDERARTLMLTFEATDYTAAEWNFCQSRPLYDPNAPHPACYSNDPHSYLTWGPNGATAGNGHEVQIILQQVDRTYLGLIDRAFAGEAAAIRRSFVIPDKDRALETYLCGIWVSPARRAAWRGGFDALGRESDTRATYDRLYESASLDGGKIATFYRAYRAHGLVPTEIDYAFFKDRAAHTTPVGSLIDAAVASALAGESHAPWQVRRAIALRVRPTAQREDRLGRDVAFYVDGAGNGALQPEELAAWKKRGMRSASEVGLSDARAAPDFAPGPAIATGIDHPSSLTPAEIAACPAAVLATQRPSK